MISDTLLMAAINWHSTFFCLFAAIACAFGAGVLFSSNIVRMAFYLVISLAATAGLFFLAGAEFVGAMQIMIYVGGTLVLLIFGVMLTAQEAFVNMKTRGGEWILAIVVGASFLLLLVNTAFNVPAWRQPHAEYAQHREAIAQANADIVLKEEEIRKQQQLHYDLAGKKDEQDKVQAKIDVLREEAEGLETKLLAIEAYKPLSGIAAQQASTAQMGWAFSGARVDDSPALTPALRRGRSGYLLAFQAVGIHLLIVLVGAAYLSRTKKFLGPRSRPLVSYESRTDRKFNFAAKAVLLLSAVMAVFQVLVGLFVLPTMLDRYPEFFPVIPVWFPLVVAAFGLLNLLLVTVMWNWQRWGLIGYWIVNLAGPLIAATFVPFSSAEVAGNVIGALFWLVIVTAALCLGRPSAWSQMD